MPRVRDQFERTRDRRREDLYLTVFYRTLCLALSLKRAVWDKH